MSDYNVRYSSSLDRYEITEENPGEVMIRKKGNTFILEFTVDVAVMYARLTGKNVTIETKAGMPDLKVTPITTADEAIEQYYKNDLDNSSKNYMQEVMQYFLQEPISWFSPQESNFAIKH